MGCVKAPVPFRDIMDVAVPVPTVRKPVKEAHWALTYNFLEETKSSRSTFGFY